MPSADVAIAVLAAGKARRFGCTKLDRICAGRPLGSWATDAAEQAGFAARYIIVGKEPPAFAKILDGWTCVFNPFAESGLASSIRSAVQAARHHHRLVIALADMPLIEPEHLSALGLPTEIAFTAYPDGSRGVPAAFPAHCFDRLMQIDTGAAQADWGIQVITIKPPCPDSLIDVDTEESLVIASGVLARRR